MVRDIYLRFIGQELVNIPNFLVLYDVFMNLMNLFHGLINLMNLFYGFEELIYKLKQFFDILKKNMGE